MVKVSCSNSEYFHPLTELFIPLDFDLFQVSVRKFPLVKYSFVFLISLGSFKTVKCAESNGIRFENARRSHYSGFSTTTVTQFHHLAHNRDWSHVSHYSGSSTIKG